MSRLVLLTALAFGCSNNALPTENNSSGNTTGGTNGNTTGGTNGNTTGGTNGNTTGGTNGGNTTGGTNGNTTGGTNGGNTTGGTNGGGGPGAMCDSACDCVTGLACFQSQCVKAPMGAVYCCDNATNCPSGQLCQSADGSITTCGGGNSTTGTGGGCKTACDCPSGQACFMGGCVSPPPGPLYCCDNGSCPAGGGFCQSQDGSFMMCGGGGTNGGMSGGSTGTVNMCTTVKCMNNNDCVMAGCNNGCRMSRGTCR